MLNLLEETTETKVSEPRNAIFNARTFPNVIITATCGV